MDRLPLELLTQVYGTILPIPPCNVSSVRSAHERAKALTSLRLVSRSWNHNILHTAELWSYITVSPWGTDALRYLERSRQAPLHIRLEIHSVRINGGPSAQELRTAVEALWAVGNRWRTYATNNSGAGEDCNWFRVVPAVSLPNLREAWLLGNQAVELHCPSLQKLHQLSDTNVHLAEAPALRSWTTAQPSDEEGWKQLSRVGRLCSNLQSLHLTGPSLGEFRIIESRPEEILPSKTLDRPTFHALQEVNIVANDAALDFVSRLHAPSLHLLVIRRYASFIPFAIPGSCPSLNRIRFERSSKLTAIRQVLSTFPPTLLQNLIIEIEKDIERLRRRAEKDNRDAAHFQWFEKHARVRWLKDPNRVSRC